MKIAVVFGVLGASFLSPSQEAPQDDSVWVQKFSALPSKTQKTILEEIEKTSLEQEIVLAQNTQSLLDAEDAPKNPFDLKEQPPWFDPKKYASGQPIKRTLLAAKDPQATAVQQRLLKNKVIYDLCEEFEYSFASNKILRLQKELRPETQLRHALQGYPPKAGLAKAVLLSLLDQEEAQDPFADYFEHAYTDRSGNVYPGVTLYDAHSAGSEIEMPDVDTIPYGWNILKDKSYEAPMTDGFKANSLYEKIGEGFVRYRRYREMLEAVASFYFAESAPVSPFVVPMKDRIHFVIAWTRNEPFFLERFLSKHREREDFIAAIDELWQELQGSASGTIESRKKQLQADHQRIREIALQVLKKHMP